MVHIETGARNGTSQPAQDERKAAQGTGGIVKRSLAMASFPRKTVADMDIGAHQTVPLEVPLPTAGVYPFHCDIDLHAALGMKGRIEAK